jgi:formylglycine-generating enzyme required for sulfatase activity
MTDRPDDIQRKIAHLETQRAMLGDAIVDEMIAKLRAQPQPAGETRGKAGVDGDNYGQNIGVNYGIAIIGQRLEEDEKRRLGWYLHNLASTLKRLRLQGIASRLAREGDGVSMPNVYVMLATTRIVLREVYEETSLQALDVETFIQQHDPDTVLPDYARTAIAVDAKQDIDTAWSSESTAMYGGLFDIHDDDLPQQMQASDRIECHGHQLTIEAMQQHPRLVLRGEPGSGKSTALFYIAWLLAWRGLGSALSDEQQQILSGWQEHLLPVVLPLRSLAGQLGSLPSRDGLLADPQACIPVVSQAIRETMHASDTHRIDDLLDSALHRGNVLVCFDGLDEVPVTGETGTRASRRATLQAVRTFAAHYPIRAVVTCRTRAFDDNEDRALLGDSWQIETLAPFTLGQMRHFIPAWYTELVEKRYLTADQAEAYTRDLLDALTDPTRPRLREMAETPLLLTLMAWVLCEETTLPRDRADLYEKVLALLLEQWDKLQKDQTLASVIRLPDWDGRRLLPLLERLSYVAHRDSTSDDGRGRLESAVLETALREQFEGAGIEKAEAAAAAVRCVDYIDQRSGLLTPDGTHSYAFAHLTLQEYCTGRHLLRRPDAIEQVMQYRTEDRWHEPIKLGIGVIQQDNPDRVTLVLRRLIDRWYGGQQKPDAVWYRDLLLAAEIGKERDWQRLREGYVSVDDLLPDLRTGLATLLNDATQPLPVQERVRAGFLLGDLGDPRFPVTIEQWQAEAERALNGDTSGYFCRVEPGTYIIGSSDDDPDARDDEKPQHTVTFDEPFWIARLPITNAQWQAWVAAGGEPSNYADDDDLNLPNQPVVGMQWYWCRDFCRWLSEQTGLTIRMPSEAEWEAAARGGDARRYPWGNDWRNDQAATGEDRETRGTRRSTPVGCYAAGTAPCGALDMAGNVWEWTHTPWTETHDPPQTMQVADDAERFTLKRGDYGENRIPVRCAARHKQYPHFTGRTLRLYFGCRVLLSPRVPSDSR